MQYHPVLIQKSKLISFTVIHVQHSEIQTTEGYQTAKQTCHVQQNPNWGQDKCFKCQRLPFKSIKCIFVLPDQTSTGDLFATLNS